MKSDAHAHRGGKPAIYRFCKLSSLGYQQHCMPVLHLDAQGRLAQLVEHFVYTEGVGGSSPSPPKAFRICKFFGAMLGLP